MLIFEWNFISSFIKRNRYDENYDEALKKYRFLAVIDPLWVLICLIWKYFQQLLNKGSYSRYFKEGKIPTVIRPLYPLQTRDQRWRSPG